ncbi:MAG: FG-GAP-like repeat-containing protein, partial [Acidobacteriota bacterium]|nr:FG-GAP-like repeat-containing protein [Acidobacteriota bacterium]
MKKGFFLLAAFMLVTVCFVITREVESQKSEDPRPFTELQPQKVKAFAVAVSPRVDSLSPPTPDPGNKSGKLGKAAANAREVPNRQPFRKRIVGTQNDVESSFFTTTGVGMPSPSLSFEGLSSNDNAAAFGFRIIPPDTNGDVGPKHFVQAVNSLLRVYDKAGNPQTPPFKLSSLFAPLGTACSTRDDGDPIVLYDTLADRWILSQYCKNIPPFRQMLAVSETSDPTGEYFVYEFIMPNVKLNDYAKLGIWHDAIYMSTDEFLGSDYAGSGAFAFEREKLIVGDPNASFIYFDLASPTTIRLGGLLPVDLDGLRAPPAASPGMFVGYSADEYGEPADALRIFEFRPDFDTPANSTFAEASESPLQTAAFDPTSENGRDDIEQPPPGEGLDSQGDRLMFRAAYRNLGSSESIVVNQTVRVTSVGQTYRAGVRVYEIRRSVGQPFTFKEQSTIGSADTSRFMAAAAQDHQGNLAVGYSTSNEEKEPSIVYTGKLSAEPRGTFRNEAIFVTGTGVQTAFGFRWGDYSGLVSDPSDGCTFWITNQYYSLQSQNESPFGWLTRIGKFRFSECVDESTTKIDVFAVNDQNNDLIPNALVKIYLNGDLNTIPYTRVTKTNGAIDPVWTPAGTHRIVVSASGFITREFDLTVKVSPNESWFLNARLTPTAVIESRSIEISSEGCAANGTIEPGETVTIDVSLQNTGQSPTSGLTATLLAKGGVLNPGPPQNYGVLTVAGEIVTRPFSFTAAPSLSCGDEIDLRFSLTDVEQNLGVLTIPVRTGISNIVFQENFDGVAAPTLPAGWSTSFEGDRENWTTSTVRSFSGPNTAFSPAPRTIGVNEIISPLISVSTADAELRFKNWYELETTFLRNRVYDGAVIEIEIGGGPWQDILEAGGYFISGGYNDGVIDACCSNPLMGRRAWSGRSGVDAVPVFIDSIVRLPASAAGNDVRFRWRVATDNGTFKEGQYIDDVEVIDGYRCDCASPRARSAPFDFDGDGKTDRSLFNATDAPSEFDFRVTQSSNGTEVGTPWGSTGDAAVNADYDGDGRTDYAVFRPSSNTWFILQSSDGMFRAFNFGLTGDLPAPADYDGDGKQDAAVYRPTEG